MPTWSGMRKKLEEEYLCTSLRGRIRYFVTRYRESHDQEGRVAILMDGKEILQSSYIAYAKDFHCRWCALRQNVPSDTEDTSDAFFRAGKEAVDNGCFDRRHFYDAFYIFDNQSIEESLSSDNPLVRVFALLDRRVGKRSLLALAEKMEQELPWVQVFYMLRLDAEGMMPALKYQQ